MRLGLDLRGISDPAERRDLAVRADELGLWAVLVGGGPTAANQTVGSDWDNRAVEAARLSQVTESIYLATYLKVSLDDPGLQHPVTAAEHLSVLDHLSQRRALGVLDCGHEELDKVRDILAGAVVDGFLLSPPPAQTVLPVFGVSEIDSVELSGDLTRDRVTIDERRDSGVTHLFVTWPGEMLVLARHLASRAMSTNFPQIVADMADEL